LSKLNLFRTLVAVFATQPPPHSPPQYLNTLEPLRIARSAVKFFENCFPGPHTYTQTHTLRANSIALLWTHMKTKAAARFADPGNFWGSQIVLGRPNIFWLVHPRHFNTNSMANILA